MRRIFSFKCYFEPLLKLESDGNRRCFVRLAPNGNRDLLKPYLMWNLPLKKLTHWISLELALGVGVLLFCSGFANAQPPGIVLSFTDASSSLTSPKHWGLETLYHPEQGLRGSASCATTSCHSGPKAGVSTEKTFRGSEYSLWLEEDPHAQSWRTLCSDESAKILSKLGILRDGKVFKADEYQNCLACHNSDRQVAADNITPRIVEGVGCEACHGASERWYDRHFQSPEAKQLAVSSLGLADTDALVQRAKVCTLCHVGGRDRDMNHDIIAAGHPALYFDLAVYYESYPKHWRDAEQIDPNFRSRLWLAGQIAMADSELELLQARALKSLPVSTWPELSNYECTSCHASLSGIPKPVPSIDRLLLARGRAPSREWNLGGVEALSTYLHQSVPELDNRAEILRSTMEAPNPSVSKISEQASSLRNLIHQSLYSTGDLSLDQWTNARQINFSASRFQNASRMSKWEYASGSYLSAWASSYAMRSTELDQAMQTIRHALLFPADTQSPKFPRTAKSTNPPNLEQWHSALRKATTELSESTHK